MGAQTCYGTAKANSMSKAWEIVYQDDIEEYGHEQGYSGHLNCCEFVRDVTREYKSMSPIQFEQWCEDNLDKREAFGYCVKEPVKNTNKIKTKVENVVQKGTRKWKIVYYAENRAGQEVVSAYTQTECIKKARVYMERNPVSQLTISIRKTLVEGNRKCAIVSYKKSSKEAPGKYNFIGNAPC